ncbi:MAG: EAL domain-containing protein [Lachnospiraceae bacterium]|nr:EAL domain-containing protein [Lachnospiraceae bacterium]
MERSKEEHRNYLGSYEIDPAQLKFAFQPIWDVRTNPISIYGYECLMRPYGNLPMSYIWAYEKAGRLNEIEEMTAYYGAKAFLDAKLEGMIFLNSFPSTCMSLQRAYETECMCDTRLIDRMVIEILEYTKHDDFSWQVKKRAFEAAGVHPRYALDDFGTGENQDLECIHRYHPDLVKIDRKYISNIDSDPVKQHIVKTMVLKGHHDGIEILAEGVERKEEYDYLLPLVDYMQGFYLGKPKIYESAHTTVAPTAS